MNSADLHDWVRKTYSKMYKVNQTCTVKEVKACVAIVIDEHYNGKLNLLDLFSSNLPEDLYVNQVKNIKQEWKKAKYELDEL